MNFKEPFKAPNKKTDLNKVKFPKLISYKLDGIRSEFIEGQMLSRSLKQIVNKQVRDKLSALAEYSSKNNVILDGEIYGHGVPFSIISSCVMTQDYTDKKSIKAWEKLCIKHKYHKTREETLAVLKYYAFDCVRDWNFDEPFIDRLGTLKYMSNMNEFKNIFVNVEQTIIESKKEVEEWFERAIKYGYEGLMLKTINSRYKCGRATLKEDLIYKVKPWEDFDARIIGIKQSTEVDINAEKKINELGRSVTSKKKGDRHFIEKASAFIVLYEGKECKPTLSMTDEEKIEVWANRELYIGKIIEYRGMIVGSLDVPRHPTFTRFRPDKEGE